MTLAQFITANIEAILTEWETFARSFPPGAAVGSTNLRDDAERMLRFVIAELGSAQSETERAARGGGQKVAGSESTAAHLHGRLRLTQAFDLPQIVSEFRALRASVIRLWSAHQEADLPASELIRFNEAIDQLLADSVQRYADDMERARDLLLAVLSHDLRNPLSSILMSAEVLARTQPLTPRQDKLTADIIRGAERMRAMIHDLLDLTRTRLSAKLEISQERCDLFDVCRNIAEETHAGNPQREISVESSGDCVGWWNCARIARLVSNLVGNAVQHGQEKTLVRITVVGDDPAVVALTVENRGRAIPPEFRSSIFAPLNHNAAARDHGQIGSVGLGLYIAKEIVLAHGGSIALLRSDEAGTMFEARLPRIAAV